MFERAPAPTPESQTARPAGVWSFVDPRTVSVAVIFLAVLIRVFAPLDADIDWLMSVCRAVLSGKRLYVDIVETNPPMAIFIYMPAAVIEKLTHLPAEAVFTAMMLVGGSGAAWVLSICARRAGETTAWLLPVMLMVLLVAPLEAFGQREHVALLLLTPILGVAMLRMARQTVPVWLILIAGLGAGMAPMIKPFFVYGIVAVYGILAVRRRNLRLLLCPEALLAASLTVLYAVWVWREIPVYLHNIVPMLYDIYAPMRLSFFAPGISVKVMMWLLSIACLYAACGKRVFDPAPLVLMTASAGFVVSFVEQGRGWPYHAMMFILPTLLAVLLCTETGFTRPNDQRGERRLLASLAALVLATSPLGYFLLFGYLGGGVVPAIRAAVKHPSVMSITFDQRPGHPITTEVHGTWVGTYSSRWITLNARYLLQIETDPAKRARLENWLRVDRRAVNHDLTKRPDIVLVGLGPFDWPGWIAADPQTKALMADYVPLATDRLSPTQRKINEGVTAYIRKDLRPAPPATP
ncbi:hypothetical protein [Asticcacaulis sp. EMRT-3]|uniref:hypothetical protein n=1 Tax=Asticcacaulis sp. EMRT-3 TaxID=3040349 RepID=UPI0024AF1FBF|nr:hypothetical protein [Asticcacaulis sp. EMRT-3]MDI7775956.1 hypothetical protein [Asticcacaulis sp. EMRT-3]